MGASILMAIVMMFSAGSSEPDAQACIAYGANFRPLTFGGRFLEKTILRETTIAGVDDAIVQERSGYDETVGRILVDFRQSR